MNERLVEGVHILDYFSNIEKHRLNKEELAIWVGLRAGDHNLIQFMNPGVVASTRYGHEIVHLEDKLQIFSIEKNTKIRTDSNMDEHRGQLKDIGEYLSNFDGNNINMICYHSTLELEQLSKKFPKIKIWNPPFYLKQYLDQKSVVRKALRARNVSVIPGIEGIIGQESFDSIAQKISVPFVVSIDDSAAGYGVFLVNEESEYKKIKSSAKGKSATFTKFIDGISASISAVRTMDFNIYSEPSLQIIGQPELTKHRFGWGGNDYNIGAKISEQEMSEMQKITSQVGDWLDFLNYRGFYGIDFLIDANGTYLTEINPRFLGSSALLIDRQIETNKVPLTFFHTVPYMDNLYISDEFVEQYNLMSDPLNVSQLVLHNLTGHDVMVNKQLLSGRYAFEKNKLEYLGFGTHLSDTKSYSEILIGGDIPLTGTTILKDSDEICKIFMYREALDAKGRNLNGYAKNLVNAVYDKIISKY